MDAEFSSEGKTCDALREWLRSHSLPTRGRKADLEQRYRSLASLHTLPYCMLHYVCRVENFIAARVAQSAAHSSSGANVPTVTQPTSVAIAAQPSTSSPVPLLPSSGWQSGKSTIIEKGFKITRPFIYDYFVQRLTHKGPSNNFRALKSGYNLFASGHVQSVKVAAVDGQVHYKSSILPSMKKDKAYSTSCSIDVKGKKIAHAHCSCPAGISESCVHVSALLHALECLFESPKNTQLVESAVGVSKTSQQCTWLKPRARKVSATRAMDITYVKHEYGKKKRKTPPPADFDPRPPSKRGSAILREARQKFCKSIKGSGICAELLLDS